MITHTLWHGIPAKVVTLRQVILTVVSRDVPTVFNFSRAIDFELSVFLPVVFQAFRIVPKVEIFFYMFVLIIHMNAAIDEFSFFFNVLTRAFFGLLLDALHAELSHIQNSLCFFNKIIKIPQVLVLIGWTLFSICT